MYFYHILLYFNFPLLPSPFLLFLIFLLVMTVSRPMMSLKVLKMMINRYKAGISWEPGMLGRLR